MGSISLKPFTSTTTTLSKQNKVNDVKTTSSSSKHNSTTTHGPKGTTEKVSYHKVAFKFYKREFDDKDFSSPLMVVIEDFSFAADKELVSLLSDCKDKELPSGTQKITCAPFDPEA